jgi:hypothetical protein
MAGRSSSGKGSCHIERKWISTIERDSGVFDQVLLWCFFFPSLLAGKIRSNNTVTIWTTGIG